MYRSPRDTRLNPTSVSERLNRTLLNMTRNAFRLKGIGGNGENMSKSWLTIFTSDICWCNYHSVAPRAG